MFFLGGFAQDSQTEGHNGKVCQLTANCVEWGAASRSSFEYFLGFDRQLLAFQPSKTARESLTIFPDGGSGFGVLTVCNLEAEQQNASANSHLQKHQK